MKNQLEGLAGRVAIVTGAAQGLGFAIAERLVAQGTLVVMADIQKTKVHAAAERIDGSGGSAIAVEVNVTSAVSVEAMVGLAASRFGRLDFLVNSAGGSGSAEAQGIEDVSEEVWESIISTNLRGTFFEQQICIESFAEK